MSDFLFVYFKVVSIFLIEASNKLFKAKPVSHEVVYLNQNSYVK